MGTDLYKQDLGSIPPVSRLWRVAPDAQKSPVPSWERGTGGISKQIYRAFARLEMMNRIDN